MFCNIGEYSFGSCVNSLLSELMDISTLGTNSCVVIAEDCSVISKIICVLVYLESYERPPCELEQAAKFDLEEVKSPKSVALPVVAMVMYSIVFVISDGP